jgi:hypothetical protein
MTQQSLIDLKMSTKANIQMLDCQNLVPKHFNEAVRKFLLSMPICGMGSRCGLAVKWWKTRK